MFLLKYINHLNNITMLKNEVPDYPIGFSDHSIGTELACAAVALGASLIEKHFNPTCRISKFHTLDRNGRSQTAYRSQNFI